MSKLRRGRKSGGGSGRPPFDGEHPRLRFEDVVAAGVNEPLPAGIPGREKGASPRPSAVPWREVDTDTGALVIVCPGCWPGVEARMRGRSGVEVRLLVEQPEWARCAVCDPEQVC